MVFLQISVFVDKRIIHALFRVFVLWHINIYELFNAKAILIEEQ